MASANTSNDDAICRLLVIGSNRVRLGRIFSSLVVASQSNLVDDVQHANGSNLRVEYLPCVATFASYKNESGINLRYLERVEYYPHDSIGALSSVASSLLPFFDQDSENKDRFPPIAGVAVGGGIEGPDDTAHIDGWIHTMLSGNKDPIQPKIKTIEPNPVYDSMSDELAAYKQLSAAEKEIANRQQTMGPEKMVKFVIDFTIELVQEAYSRTNHDAELLVVVDDSLVEPVPDVPHIIDPAKNRYLCRMCRTTLFGENDIQDPPHEVSQHQFSRRKMHHGTTSIAESVSDRCQSFFLQQGIDWMGEEIKHGVAEGKFNCPNCTAKIGTWIWSGTQCSCGTWVVPAIQVPKSKVDVVKPTIHQSPLTISIDTIREMNAS